MSDNKGKPPAIGQEGNKNKHDIYRKFSTETHNFVNIPFELKRLNQWVNWGVKIIKDKIKKPPFKPGANTEAKTSNPTTWDSYSKATFYFEGDRHTKICGIGFVLTEEDPFCVIDLDNCRNPETGEIEPWAEEIISKVNSYTEISPSGEGFHIWIKGKNPFNRKKLRIKIRDGKTIKIEIYDDHQYITVTGDCYNEYNSINERQEEIEAALGPFFDQVSDSSKKATPHCPNQSCISPLSDEEIIAKAKSAKNGDKFRRLWSGGLSDHGDDHSGGDEALCSMLAFYTKDPDQIDRIFRQSGLMRPKWDEKHYADGSTYGQMTIKNAIDYIKKNPVKSETSEYIGSAIPSHTRPILDEKAFYGFAGRFVELATRNSEADPAAVLATFLVRFGVEVGPDVGFMIGDTKHYARLFAVIVGETSKARKGTSAGPVERLFAFSAIRTSPGPLSSGEGLIAAVQDNSEGTENPSKRNKCLFVLDQEFAAALSCTKREGNTLSTTIRAAWDSGNLDPLTKHEKISTTNAHIGIISHITLFELKRKMHNIEAFNGFANRILWVFSMRGKLVPLPPPMPDDEFAQLVVEIRSILGKVSRFSLMKFSREAETYWTYIYPELSESPPGLVGSVTSRSEAQVLRLAMVYCLLDSTDTIEVVHIEAALAFWEYCEKSAMLIFGDRENDSTTQRIVDKLKTGPTSKTEIHRHFSKHIKRAELETALKELKKQGRIQSEKVETAGAPKTVYKLMRPN